MFFWGQCLSSKNLNKKQPPDMQFMSTFPTKNVLDKLLLESSEAKYFLIKQNF